MTFELTQAQTKEAQTVKAEDGRAEAGLTDKSLSQAPTFTAQVAAEVQPVGGGNAAGEINFAVNDPMPGDKRAKERAKGEKEEEEDESLGSQATRAERNGDVDGAEKLWLKQLKQDEDSKDPGKIAVTARAVAGFYLSLGNIEKAKTYTDQSITNFEKMDDRHPMKNAMLGSLHHFKGEVFKDEGRRAGSDPKLTPQEQEKAVIAAITGVDASLRKSKEYLDKIDPKTLDANDPQGRVMSRVRGTYDDIANFFTRAAKFNQAQAKDFEKMAAECRARAEKFK